MYVVSNGLILRDKRIVDEDTQLYYKDTESAKPFQFSRCTKIKVSSESFTTNNDIDWIKIPAQCALEHIPGNNSGSARFKYKSGDSYELPFMYLAYRRY